MSLTHEQRYLLEELREYLRRVEKMAMRYNVELDSFDTNYKETGFHFGQNGVSSVQERAAGRRAVFSRSREEEKVNYYLPESD